MRAVHFVVGAAVRSSALLVAALLALGVLAPAAAGAGLLAVVVGCWLLVRALRRRGGAPALGPADVVTLVRLVLVGVVVALVVDPYAGGSTHGVAVAAVSLVVILLDGVDGRVARATGTASELGARFDMETDAFLILVLSVFVAALLGPWVLLIGLARYLFVAASWALPWLRESSPPRYWCKVVAVVQGVVLAVVATGALPDALAVLVTAIALALLAESFGRDVVWLFRHRDGRVPVPASRWRRAGRLVTAAALLLVWVALLAPVDLGSASAAAWLAVPVEGVVLALLIGTVGTRAGRFVAASAGAVLGVVVLVKVLDLGFVSTLGRPFQPLSDWTYLGYVPSLLADGAGQVRAQLAVVGAVAAAVGVLLLLPASAYHLAHVAQRHRRQTLLAAGALGAVWVLASVTGVHVGSGEQVASARSAAVVERDVRQTLSALSDGSDVAAASADDPWAQVPSDRLLSALRGKDVLVVFVESYGRTALEDQAGSAGLRAQLDAGTAQLGAAGWSARSAWLTSPTFAGISWLAHSTLQSGLWVDTQRRYDALLTTRRLTLASAFAAAGWRTVAVVPSNERPWPEGQQFYGYEHVYDEHNSGYAGQRFGYATMPDQYTLEAFRRTELAAGHRPVFAEVDLATSHAPWTPVPRLVPWKSVGDGSVFRGMTGPKGADIWSDPVKVRAAYESSISYSLATMVSFLQSERSDLVVLVLGDHQPATIVSGTAADHDVPVTVVARDPGVVAAIADWGWQDGLRPDDAAPVWRMDAVRDHVLSAFSRR